MATKVTIGFLFGRNVLANIVTVDLDIWENSLTLRRPGFATAILINQYLAENRQNTVPTVDFNLSNVTNEQYKK